MHTTILLQLIYTNNNKPKKIELLDQSTQNCTYGLSKITAKPAENMVIVDKDNIVYKVIVLKKVYKSNSYLYFPFLSQRTFGRKL